MTTHLQWLLLQLTRRLWVRATAFSVLAVITALIAVPISRFIPANVSTQIGADAVDSLLNVIAASMLSVTIFSLSTLVAALGAAASGATPRATRLLSEDRTAQNALATFMGAFMFSLVGIIALQTGIYGGSGRAVLYVVTIVVIAIVIGTLVRWIHHISRFGRLAETTARVEHAAAKAIRWWHDNPSLGGHPLDDDSLPDDKIAVTASRMGYIEHVDLEALSKTCGGEARTIYVMMLPGGYVDPSRPLAYVVGPCGAAVEEEVRDAFSIADARSYDQDPRFGASVLAEIASRALSPAVNDPGTAIDVLGRVARLLAITGEPPRPEAREIKYPRLHVIRLRIDDLFDDVFTPIARDGAGLVEVAIRVQKTLRILGRLGTSHHAAAVRHSDLALARAEHALTLEDDRRRVREIAAEIPRRELAAG